MASIPAGSWDTHHHIFDPDKYPYVPNPPYNAPKRTIHDAVAALPTANHVITMSLPEGTDVRHTLSAIRDLDVLGRIGRGCIVLDLEDMTPERLAELHHGGVRAVRAHIVRMQAKFGPGIESIKKYLAETARLMSEGGPSKGWVLDAQFELDMWDELAPTLRELHERYGTVFVVDHIFCAGPDDADQPAFRRVLQLLEDGVAYVKVSGLDHRTGDRGAAAMQEVVKAVLAVRGGGRAMWGSDWPHTLFGKDYYRNTDVNTHLVFLEQWSREVGDGVWEKVMRDTAQAVYA